MIIWINGAFGSGKTSVAEAIDNKTENSFIYDPENVGYFLWGVFPDEMKRKGNFQHIGMWREFNYRILRYINDNTDKVIIIPMTVYVRQYYDEIIGTLRKDGVDVKLFILSASKRTIIGRLVKRGDAADGWAAQHIGACLEFFAADTESVNIDTENKSINEIADSIIKLSFG